MDRIDTPRAAVRAAILCSAIVIAALAGAARADGIAVVARIESLEGTAVVERVDGDVAVGPGAELGAGDTLQTGPDARLRLLFVDGSTLIVGPGAQVKIDRFDLAPDGTRQDALVTLFNGVVRAVVAPGAQQSFTLHGQAAVASVRGTELVMIEGAGETAVFVVSGHVLVEAPVGNWLVKLDEGQGAEALAATAAPLPTVIPPEDSEPETIVITAPPAPQAAVSAPSGSGGAATAPQPADAAPVAAAPPQMDQVRLTIANMRNAPPAVGAWDPVRVGALLALTAAP